MYSRALRTPSVLDDLDRLRSGSLHLDQAAGASRVSCPASSGPSRRTSQSRSAPPEATRRWESGAGTAGRGETSLGRDVPFSPFKKCLLYWKGCLLVLAGLAVFQRGGRSNNGRTGDRDAVRRDSWFAAHGAAQAADAAGAKAAGAASLPGGSEAQRRALSGLSLKNKLVTGGNDCFSNVAFSSGEKHSPEEYRARVKADLPPVIDMMIDDEEEGEDEEEDGMGWELGRRERERGRTREDIKIRP